MNAIKTERMAKKTRQGKTMRQHKRTLINSPDTNMEDRMAAYRKASGSKR